MEPYEQNQSREADFEIAEKYNKYIVNDITFYARRECVYVCIGWMLPGNGSRSHKQFATIEKSY